MTTTTGDRWFYHPTDRIYAHPQEFGLTQEDVFFSGDGAALHGWFFRAQGTATPKGTVVHCHGNGGNVTGHFQFVEWMPRYGWNVFVFDYQGFGRSKGVPSRFGTIADTHAAIDCVRGRDDVDAERIVLFGQSLGGAVAIVVAAQRSDLCGVAVEGAFASYRGAARFVVGRRWWMWGAYPILDLMIAAGCDPIDSVAEISPTPLLFITGTNDCICDHRQTLALHRAAKAPKDLWVIDGGGHMTALVDTDGEGQRRVDSFFSSCVRDISTRQASAAGS